MPPRYLIAGCEEIEGDGEVICHRPVGISHLNESVKGMALLMSMEIETVPVLLYPLTVHRLKSVRELSVDLESSNSEAKFSSVH